MRSMAPLLHRTHAIAIPRPHAPRWLSFGLAALLTASPFAARADDDLPGRVGRIAEFAGQLYLAPADNAAGWAAIGINYPVTSGDNLWVSGDGHAEVDYGAGQFRLAGDTNLLVSRLDDRQLALFIARGRLIVRVRVLDTDDEVRIDTPNTQVALTRPGLYRIDVTDRETTTLTVREGEGVVALAFGTQQTLPGQRASVTGVEPMSAEIRNGSGVDGFDTWSANRDRRYERGRSTAFVSRQMVGSAELDEYGSWEDNPTYGAVWYPTTVAAEWTPYREGYWTTVAPWGLTWVDAAPWGYAPSHYGRWVRTGGRWGWCPGSFVARPHWAPAMVGWYGGARWGAAAHAGAPVYGWVPLGWGDAYRPWWTRCSQRCWAQYNRGHAANMPTRPDVPPARYSNMGIPGAMTAVAGATLVGRKPVAANTVPLPPSMGMSAPLLATAPVISPVPSQLPALRPGERGTPMPASLLFPSVGRAPSTGVPFSKPDSMPGTAAGNAPSSAGSGRGTSGTPFTRAPSMRPAPATSPPPVAEAALTQRVGVPAASLPVTTNPLPTVRPSAARDTPSTTRGSVSSTALPATVVAPAHVPAVRAGGLGTVGIALPPPAAAIAPQPAARPIAAPSPGQPVPSSAAPQPATRPIAAPSLGQQVPLPGTPHPAPPASAPTERPAAKPADANAAKAGTVVDKVVPGGGGPALR